MKVVEVDYIGPQITERSFALRAHEFRIVEVIRRPFDPAEFRGQKNFLARNFGKYLTNQLFCVAVAIGVGCVPMRNAASMRRDEGLLRQPVVVTTPAD